MADDHTGLWGRREFLQATGAAGAFAAFGGVTAADSDRDLGAKEDELLVGISSSTSMLKAQAEIQDALPAGARVVKRNDTLGYMGVKMPDKASAQADSSAAQSLKELSGIKYVEENKTHEALMTPDDEYFGDQYAPQQVKAPEAWEITTGSKDVTVAIVDQGVKYDHPDLEAQFGSNKGKDFADGDSDPYPDSMSDEYHGTHVGGTVAATMNNGTGVAGMSDSTLLSGRALGDDGSGSTDGIADAVQWATDQGADIINMSLGGGGYTDTMKNAVSYAVDNGTLPICAAGNDYGDPVSYPAAYDECIAVSAVDENENIADFSNTGSKVDVAAPGVDVLSTWTEPDFNGEEYSRISGTSMACPATSGVAALGLAAHPEWSVSELRSQLKDTADDIGLDAEKQGSGRVNAYELVKDNEPQEPVAEVSLDPSTPAPGDEVTFDASDSYDPDGTIEKYEWSGAISGSGEVITETFDEEGEYQVTLTVTDSDDLSDSETVTFTVSAGESPVAKFSYTDQPVEGDAVTFDGTDSYDPDGSVTTYEWSGAIAGNGSTITETFEEPGDYDVTLTVTDDAGLKGDVTKTVTVDDAGGQCGDEKNTASGSGYLYGYYDDTSYTYTSALSSPCQLTISLDGPYYGDFDLYVTTDGSTPSTWNYDKRSVTQDSQEQIIIDNIEPGQDFGILVDSYEGSGNFTVTVEELGK